MHFQNVGLLLGDYTALSQKATIFITAAVRTWNLEE